MARKQQQDPDSNDSKPSETSPDLIQLVKMEEVRKHATSEDCWMVINDTVWDVTSFLQSHPGGEEVLLQVAGMDASAPFNQVHPKDLANRLLSSDLIQGRIDRSTVTDGDLADVSVVTGNELEKRNPDVESPSGDPPLKQMLNLFDFEMYARQTMEKQAWSYYSSGADDEITLRENHAAFGRIWLKPRILINVSAIDLSTSIPITGSTSTPTLRPTSTSTSASGLRSYSALPLYITATALAKLAHPDGEIAITRAAGKQNLIYMLPTLSSCTLDEMLQARLPDQVCWSQLYVNPDRRKTQEYLEKLEAEGVKGVFITVDAPQLGRREKDMRNKFSRQGSSVQRDDNVNRDQGVTRAISSYIDPSLSWRDIPWFKSVSSLPIYLKGIQCAEDAVLALQAGCAGIVLSNHGGRQLDMARSAVEVLPEVMAALRQEPGYSKEHFQVFVDGGIRRGADIFKCIALGATAVGIGRPVLYALGTYGQEGIEHAINILADELEMCMRLMGTPTVSDIAGHHVITRNLCDHFAAQPPDHLSEQTYEKLRTTTSKEQAVSETSKGRPGKL